MSRINADSIQIDNTLQNNSGILAQALGTAGSGAPHTIPGSSTSITISANSRLLIIFGAIGSTAQAELVLRDNLGNYVSGIASNPNAGLCNCVAELTTPLSAGTYTYYLTTSNSMQIDSSYLSIIEIPSTCYAARAADFTGVGSVPYNTFTEQVISTKTGITIADGSRLAIHMVGNAGSQMSSGIGGIRYRLKKSITPGETYFMSPALATRNMNALSGGSVSVFDVTPPLDNISPAETYTLEILAYYTDPNSVSNSFGASNLFVVELPY